MKRAAISDIFTKTNFYRIMLTFRIEAKQSSPEVLIDKKNHLIEISGSSTLKNTSWFYSNLLKWAVAFNLEGAESTTINIRLKKINESSSKWLMLIIKKMSVLVQEQEVNVNWYYEEKNTTMQLNGERLKLNSMIPVKLIAA